MCGKVALSLMVLSCLSSPAHAWMLHINGKLPARFPDHLEAVVSDSSENEFGRRLDVLLDASLDKDPQMKELNRLVSHYRTPAQRFVASTKEGTEFMIPYRGFGPSKEAGNAVLGENMKLKSRSAAEYARQKYIDERHLLIVTTVMQMAAGMGMADRERGGRIAAHARTNLTSIVGIEEAGKTTQLLSSWIEDLRVPDQVYTQPVWDVFQRGDKFKLVLTKALEDDPVVREIIKHIHKYNRKSKFVMASASVVETLLGAAALAPMFAGPAAKVALLAFIMSTGGPEGCKVMKELYLDKRLESRFAVFSEEVHLALENYQLGLLTRNPLLLALSESLISEVAGDQAMTQVLGTSLFGEVGAWKDQQLCGGSSPGGSTGGSTGGSPSGSTGGSTTGSPGGSPSGSPSGSTGGSAGGSPGGSAGGCGTS